jgi:hypothetical protein
MSKPATPCNTIPNSGLGKVYNSEAWGIATADKRYGKSPHAEGRGVSQPKDMSMPQDKQSRCSDPTYNDVSERSWLRGGSPAESKPGYYRGKQK